MYIELHCLPYFLTFVRTEFFAQPLKLSIKHDFDYLLAYGQLGGLILFFYGLK